MGLSLWYHIDKRRIRGNMNKIAFYLNSHILGEIRTNPRLRAAYAHDGSIVATIPDMVGFPRQTNDIRKIMRFSWQLAEKGHVLPVVARGNGTDKTGAATGKGMVLSLSAHMNNIFEYDAKQRLVRLQPGVTVNAVQNALSLQGVKLPIPEWGSTNGTIGGLVASSRASLDYVNQLEVVLASGDVIQTKKLTKREVAKKKGEQTFEGTLYREVDALFEENKEVIDSLADGGYQEHGGYAAVVDVRGKNGSIDLAPLFAGTGGQLGVISEMILSAEYMSGQPTIITAAFVDAASARDAVDAIRSFDNSVELHYLESAYFETAQKAGKTLGFYEDAVKELKRVEVVLVVNVVDFSSRARLKNVKKITKKLQAIGARVTTSDPKDLTSIQAVDMVSSWLLNPEEEKQSAPAISDGFVVPYDRFEDFAAALSALATKLDVKLPLYGRPLDNIWYTRPVLNLDTVGDKQKALKLARDISQLVTKCKGTMNGEHGYGTLKNVYQSSFSDEQEELFVKIKSIFDPHGILGNSTHEDVRAVAKHLRASYVGPAANDYVVEF